MPHLNLLFRRRSIVLAAVLTLGLSSASALQALQGAEQPRFLMEWGERGSETGKFDFPIGIAISRNDEVFVTDFTNSRVQKFSSDGTFLAAFEVSTFPGGIALDQAGNVFTTESTLGRVQKFTSAGNFLLAWGDNEVGPGKFGGKFTGLGPSKMQGPTGITVDQQGELWVNAIGGRIQKFSGAGTYVDGFAEEGTKPGQFYAPHGIAIDSRGCLYIVDAFNHRIQKFDTLPVAERNALKIPTKITGAYKGGKLVQLRVRDRIAYLITPTGEVDAQKRWLWDFPFWLAINDGFGSVAHRHYVEKLLSAGFHVAGVDVGPSCGSPAAAEVCQEFYEQLVSKHQLHTRARVLAHSHGGLIAYGWAFRHPTCVDRLAGMCPATDFRTYPTLPGVVAVPTKGLDYGLSLVELERRAAEFNPIDNLAPLAKAGVKLMHLHGDPDTLIPTTANSTELARRYRELGGAAEIVLLKDLGAERENSRGHDGPELYNSAQLVQFLLAD